MGDNPINFFVHNATREDYLAFVKKLQGVLAVGVSHGVPVLGEQPPHPTSWIDINMYATPSEFVTVRLRRHNLYVDGYRVSGGQSPWQEFALEGNNTDHLIPGSELLPFTGGYPALERAAGTASRANILLGQPSLVTALQELRDLNSANPAARFAKSLIVIIQMISEAVRFDRIRDCVAEHWMTPAGLQPSEIGLENSWGALSSALLRLDQNPERPFYDLFPANRDINILSLADAVSALGILLFFRDPGWVGIASLVTSRLAVIYQSGRPLLEVLWVRIEDIDGEDPGDLYGTIQATDGVAASPYSLFNRTSSTPQSVGPGGNVELTGPQRAISASDSVALHLKLWDRDPVRDDEIVNTVIYWNPYSATNRYNCQLVDPVVGQYGKASVGYAVVGNAAEAVIEIVLINGDDEDKANVYGDITAKTGMLDTITLFKRARGDYTDVSPNAAIPLLRAATVVQMYDQMTISASLWDYDSLSSDDDIATGSVMFQPGLGHSNRDVIRGERGRIEVRVTWY